MEKTPVELTVQLTKVLNHSVKESSLQNLNTESDRWNEEQEKDELKLCNEEAF